jgi:hypothetical protein
MNRWRPIFGLGLSLVLCVIASIAYFLQPDSWAALLILPRWIWLVFGLLLGTFGWSQSCKLLTTITALLWLLYAVVLVEEVGSLARWCLWRDPQSGIAVRVVSLNCGGGNPNAAEEVLAYHPDIVLLQESPLRQDVEALARRLFGAEPGILYGPDTSIIVRGQLTPSKTTLPRDIHVAQAHVRLVSGLETVVLSVRLPPLYELRTDLWSSGCWHAQSNARRTMRRLMDELGQQIDTIPRNTPVLVGGDFNAPAQDGPFHALQARLQDAFRYGGVGWGNTIINDLPIIRIDQIWVSDQFHTERVVARRTLHSDHRLVVCDLTIRLPSATVRAN